MLKPLPENHNIEELASGALVISAPSSNATGSSVRPAAPIMAKMTNRAAVLFGRTDQ